MMQYHTTQPKNLWFESDNYQHNLRYSNLMPRQLEIVESIREAGFYHLTKAFNDYEIRQLNAALDGWVSEHEEQLNAHKREDSTYPRLIGLDQEIPAIQQLFEHPVMQMFQDLLFGHRCALCTSITFLQGSQQALHRDIPIYKTSQEHLFFRVWIALEDAGVENGTLMGVRGGHKVATEQQRQHYTFYPSKAMVPAQDPVRWHRYQEALGKAYEKAGLSVEPFTLSRGDVVIWHPLFPHGGTPIQDKSLSRRSVVLHFSMIPLNDKSSRRTTA